MLSRQVYWGALPFPSPVDHILSNLSAMTICLGWSYMAWGTEREQKRGILAVHRGYCNSFWIIEGLIQGTGSRCSKSLVGLHQQPSRI